MTRAEASTETIDVRAGYLMEKVMEVVHEGNVGRIFIKDASAKTVMKVPVTVGVLGVLAAPSMAAICALPGLVAKYSIDVERDTAESAEPYVTVSA